MGRHEQREQVFSLLFRTEFHPAQDMPVQEKLFFEYKFDDEKDPKIPEKDKEYIAEKYEKVAAKLPEIDAMLNEKAEGWNTGRMGKVELTLLRLGIYEILFDETVPAGVAINEAVELAKKYGQETSGGFVNAILAKFVKAKQDAKEDKTEKAE